MCVVRYAILLRLHVYFGCMLCKNGSCVVDVFSFPMLSSLVVFQCCLAMLFNVVLPYYLLLLSSNAVFSCCLAMLSSNVSYYVGSQCSHAILSYNLVF